MVASTSAAAQASENEKRRKQALEKVKANHLSRQLQMRLQYARLKVEHGWQKQNLNEVENLYFHNSHLRTSKPFTQAISPVVTIQPQQTSTFPAPTSIPAQSSLSFKLGTSALGWGSMTASNAFPSSGHEPSKTSPEESTSTPKSQPPAPGVPSTSTPSHDASPKAHAPNAPAPMALDPNPAISSQQDPASGAHIANIQNATQSLTAAHPIDAIKSAPTPQSIQPLVDNPASTAAATIPETTSTSITNHYPTVKPPRPRSQKGSIGIRTQPTLTAKDMYNFGSTSALTYDSFWSSHSVAGAVRPPARGSFGVGVADLTGTFQIPGDFTSGISDPGRTANAAPATTAYTFAPSSNLHPYSTTTTTSTTMTMTSSLDPSRSLNNLPS